MTLTDCTYAGGRGVFFSIGTEEFTVNRAYFGAHLEGDDAFRFDAATLFLDYLEHWATESALEMSVEFEHDIPVKHEVRYGKQEMPRAVVGPRTVQLALLRELPLDLTRTVTLSETPCFNVRFESAEHVDTILRDTIFPLQNLSSLASDHRTRIRGLQLSRGAAGDATRVHLLFQQIPGPTGLVPKRLWAEQMLVTSRDVPMERLLTAWLPFAAEHPNGGNSDVSFYRPSLARDNPFRGISCGVHQGVNFGLGHHRTEAVETASFIGRTDLIASGDEPAPEKTKHSPSSRSRGAGRRPALFLLFLVLLRFLLLDHHSRRLQDHVEPFASGVGGRFVRGQTALE